MAYGSTVTKAPTPAPAKTNIFYVILGTLCDGFLIKDEEFQSMKDIETAQRFSTMGQALVHINLQDDLGPITIQRVTETTIPGASTKRILKLNDTAPEGAELEFVVFNGYFADGDVRGVCDLRDNGLGYASYGNIALNDAPLFTSEMDAVSVIRGKMGAYGVVVRRVVTDYKPVVTTSVETVK